MILHRTIVETDGITYSVGERFYVDFMSENAQECIILDTVSHVELNSSEVKWLLRLMPVDRFKEIVINFLKEEMGQ